MEMVEIFGSFAWTNVVACVISEGTNNDEGVQCRVVADGITMANGIETSVDGKLVIVASTGAERLITFHADPKRPLSNLVHVRDIPIRGFPDNIMMDGLNHVLVAVHPLALTFAVHGSDPNNYKAPSEVIRVNIDNTKEATIETLFLDPSGELISGSTVATIEEDGVLLMGSVHDHGILKCENWNASKVQQASTRTLGLGRVLILVMVVVLLGLAPVFCCLRQPIHASNKKME